MLRPRRWWFWMGFALTAILFAAILTQRRPDDAEVRLKRLKQAGFPTTPAELNAWYDEPPPGENLAPGLLDAVNAFRLDSSDTHLPVLGEAERRTLGQPWPQPYLPAARAFRKANEAQLAALHSALTRSRARYPVDLSKGNQSRLPALATIETAAKILTFEARFASEEGRPHDALVALTNGLHLANTLEAEPLLISFLVMKSILLLQLETAEHVLSRAALEDADLRALQDRFLASAETTTPLRAMAGELVEYSDLLHLPWSSFQPTARMWSGSSTTPEVVIHLYWFLGLQERDRRVGVKYLDQLIAAARDPTNQRAKLARQAQDEVDRAMNRHFLPIAQMLLPALSHVTPHHIRNVASLRAAAAACAIERFRLSHQGRRPENLEELVPRFLTSVPLDPWTSKPLGYREQTRGYVVYGVGGDGQDDGGVPISKRPAGQAGGYDDTFTVVQ